MPCETAAVAARSVYTIQPCTNMPRTSLHAKLHSTSVGCMRVGGAGGGGGSTSRLGVSLAEVFACV